MGLGLYIVKSIVDLHDGRIVVRDLAPGTAVDISMPLAPSGDSGDAN